MICLIVRSILLMFAENDSRSKSNGAVQIPYILTHLTLFPFGGMFSNSCSLIWRVALSPSPISDWVINHSKYYFQSCRRNYNNCAILRCNFKRWVVVKLSILMRKTRRASGAFYNVFRLELFWFTYRLWQFGLVSRWRFGIGTRKECVRLGYFPCFLST